MSSKVSLETNPHSLADVDGWPITIANLATAIEDVIAAVQAGDGFSLVTLNVDHLVKLRRDAAFQRAYRAARFVTADGEPVAHLARTQDANIERTTGADLVVPLSRAAAANDIPIFLFGSTPAVLAKAGQRLNEVADGQLDIAGTLSPSRDFDPVGAEADTALDSIEASGARLCFLALGAPKQEIFAARAVARGLKVGFISIGAALDFIAGAQVRAPEFLQRHGLEWSWRLVTQPMRLGPRYLSCAWVLADIALRGGAGRPERPDGPATS
jgi:exopolysaccharide biosynthesis WecB/TagA/CpsF family protein